MTHRAPGRPFDRSSVPGPLVPFAPLLFFALSILLALPVFLAPVGTLSAQGRSYEIEEFHTTIRVLENGRLDVLERIRFRFDGSFNGVYRTIPIEHRDPSGREYRLGLRVEGVADESGSELRWEDRKEGRNLLIQIWVPGASDASRSVTIRYQVSGALRFFEEGDSQGFAEAHDELYWNSTGDEWEVPIRGASARVELPPGAEGARATAFIGSFGSREQNVEIMEIEEGFQFLGSRELGPREGMTVVVGWLPGAVDRPGPLSRAITLIWANWFVLIPILVTLAMWRLWREKGRDPSLRPIAPWYEPPDGMTPAEVGTLVDGRPDTRDVTATLVDLAVRGYLRIEEIEKNAVAEFFTGEDYRFVRLREGEEWNDLHDHEVELLRGLFGIGGHVSSVQLSDLKDEFYKHLSDIKDGIFGRLMSLGTYQQRPDRVKTLYLTLGGIVTAVGLGVSQIFAPTLVAASPTLLTLSGVGCGIAVLAFGWFMPARTVRGTRKLEEVLGFQEFLDRVEEDRFKRMIRTPDQFEQYLPFAMALGVEGKWAKAFEDIVTEPPDWYVGHSFGPRFHTTGLTRNLGQLSSRAGTAFTSAPRSTSGGSGFGGGGGFSGGGFGGGGGGAF